MKRKDFCHNCGKRVKYWSTKTYFTKDLKMLCEKCHKLLKAAELMIAAKKI